MATWTSCSDVTPETATAPTTLPPAITGTPPSSANIVRRKQTQTGATTRDNVMNALLGRRKSSAMRALPIAISTDPVCVLSGYAA
jgi:hypothetical protein